MKIVCVMDAQDGHVDFYSDDPNVEIRLITLPMDDYEGPLSPGLIKCTGVSLDGVLEAYNEVGIDKAFVDRIFATPLTHTLSEP